MNPKIQAILCDGNHLESLDLSNNPELVCLGINYNDMDAVALNSLYRQLPDLTGKENQYDIPWPELFKMLRADHNPGYEESDKSIAESKGWEFEDKSVYSSAKRLAHRHRTYVSMPISGGRD
jgi:hypothetical protein